MLLRRCRVVNWCDAGVPSGPPCARVVARRAEISWGMGDRLRIIMEDFMSSALRNPAARFGLPGVPVGLVLAWGVSGGQAPSRAFAVPPVAESASTIVVTSNSPRGDQLLYLIDTKNQAF